MTTTMRWGTEPELVGPRHRFRVGLMVRTVAAHLPPDGPAVRVLDAGAGRGTLALALARRGYAVAAVEESSAFVEYLAARAAASRVGERLRVVRADVTALPLCAGGVDGVVCGEVLEHLSDDTAAVRELTRVLRPGGLLVATVPAGAARYSWLDRWAGHARRYEPGELRQLIIGAGLEVIRLHHWGFPFGLLYERLVQRPVLARHARRGRSGVLTLQVGRAPIVTRLAAALFALDHAFDSRPWGPGLLLVARKR
jgi:SAM-dependent methyltransferase